MTTQPPWVGMVRFPDPIVGEPHWVDELSDQEADALHKSLLRWVDNIRKIRAIPKLAQRFAAQAIKGPIETQKNYAPTPPLMPWPERPRGHHTTQGENPMPTPTITTERAFRDLFIPPTLITIHGSAGQYFKRGDLEGREVSASGAGNMEFGGAGAVKLVGEVSANLSGTIKAISRSSGRVVVDGNTRLDVLPPSSDASSQEVWFGGHSTGLVTSSKAQVLAQSHSRVTITDFRRVTATDSAYIVVTHPVTNSAPVTDLPVVELNGHAHARVSGSVLVLVHGQRVVLHAGREVRVRFVNLTAAENTVIHGHPIVEEFQKRDQKGTLEYWLDRHAVAMITLPDGQAGVVLYKATDRDAQTTNIGKTGYFVGDWAKLAENPGYSSDTCWDPIDACGNGLHVSPTVPAAASYRGDNGMRFFEVHVPLTYLTIINDGGEPKAKAPFMWVAQEVDLWGAPLPEQPDHSELIERRDMRRGQRFASHPIPEYLPADFRKYLPQPIEETVEIPEPVKGGDVMVPVVIIDTPATIDETVQTDEELDGDVEVSTADGPF